MRFADRRPLLLVIGCGDVGVRVLRRLGGRFRVRVLTSSAERAPALRALGAVPLAGNLDHPATIARLAGLADLVLHLAPPPGQGDTDPRTRALLQALARRRLPAAMVYGSTSGVYGDCGGAWVTESRPVAPMTDRARRRVDAESHLRAWGRATGTRVARLRIPGIYAPDREGGPAARLHRGTPLLRREDDVFTNHIHADDLARACVAALMAAWAGRTGGRAYNVADDGDRLTGDHYDAVADALGLPRLPRLSREEARARFTPMQWSFMGESRRLACGRAHRELRWRPRYRTVEDALAG